MVFYELSSYFLLDSFNPFPTTPNSINLGLRHHFEPPLFLPLFIGLLQSWGPNNTLTSRNNGRTTGSRSCSRRSWTLGHRGSYLGSCLNSLISVTFPSKSFRLSSYFTLSLLTRNPSFNLTPPTSLFGRLVAFGTPYLYYGATYWILQSAVSI